MYWLDCIGPASNFFLLYVSQVFPAEFKIRYYLNLLYMLLEENFDVLDIWQF